jgi:hypothetical protein
VGAAQMWARMSTAQRALTVVALGVVSMSVFCCGGLITLSAIVGPTAQKPPPPTPTPTGVVAPPADVVASPTPAATTPAAPPPVTTAAPPPPPPPPTDVYYANCDAVRAAGAAPLYAGQPGYRPGLDRDHDGVACE